MAPPGAQTDTPKSPSKVGPLELQEYLKMLIELKLFKIPSKYVQNYKKNYTYGIPGNFCRSEYL